MVHATALVDHDATTLKCSCQKMVAAGWTVACFACGRGFEAGGPSRFAEELGDDPVEYEGTIEGYDVARDDRLVDEARRRVA